MLLVVIKKSWPLQSAEIKRSCKDNISAVIVVVVLVVVIMITTFVLNAIAFDLTATFCCQNVIKGKPSA